MTLPRLYALNEYWKDHPPIHIMVATYFGIGKKAQAKSKPPEDMISEFAAMGFEVKR